MKKAVPALAEDEPVTVGNDTTGNGTDSVKTTGQFINQSFFTSW